MIHFTFKKIAENDLSLLLPWFKKAHVAKWWPTPEKNELIQHFLKRIRSKNTFGYIVYLNNKPLGYIQYYYIDRTNEKDGAWLPPLPKTTVGIDQFIGDPLSIGKGYGTLFIKEFIDYLHDIEPDITTIILDPHPENIAAIRCYEKVGFEKIGIFTTAHDKHLLMKYTFKKE